MIHRHLGCSLALLARVVSPSSAFCPKPASAPFHNDYSSIRQMSVTSNLAEVKDSITHACQEAGRSPDDVLLVAVSKTKPLDLLQQAYDAGQRVFGENYAQELLEKASQMPKDTIWHFIGGLQSNKANKLVQGVVPYGTLVVETVNSLKVAKKLDAAMEEHAPKVLEIFVQINTSGEESKSGVSPEQAVEICRQIQSDCPRLTLRGLMTIGAPGDTGCLDQLVECRDQVMEDLGLSSLGLSMGMSGDYPEAIAKGSTNVRVGSTIFGARDYSNA